jgi:type IV pilus assembly protein PilM
MTKKNRIGIGVDVGSRRVHLAILRSSGKGITLQRLASEDLSHDAIVEGSVMDSQAVVEKISKLLKENKIVKKDAALSVGGRSVMIKKITTDEMSNDELRSAILYEAKANLPFDIGEVSFDYARLPQDDDTEGMNVLLVAAKNDIVFDSVEPFRWAGGKASLLEAEPFALQAALIEAGYIDEQGTVAALQIGFQSTDVTLFHKGQFEGNRNINLGGKSYIEGLIRRLGISFDRAAGILAKAERETEEQADLEAVAKDVSDRLAEQIERSFPEYFGGNAEKPISRIVLCGGGAHLPMLESALRLKFNVEVEIANPFRNFEIDSKTVDPAAAEMGPEYAAAVGHALRALGENHIGFNLLFPEDRPEHRRAKYAGASTILSVAGFSTLLLAVVLVHLSQESRLSSLRGRMDKLKKETDIYRDKIAVVEDLTKKRGDVAARIDVISELDKNRFARIRVMDLLNSAVPALTWITGVQEVTTSGGPGVLISGMTSSNIQVSQLMTSLMRSPMVRGVDLTVSQQIEVAKTQVTQFTLQVTVPDIGLQVALPDKPVDQLARGAKAIRDKRAAEDKLKKEASK